MIKTFAIVAITLAFMLAGAGYGILQWMAADLPSPARLQSIQPSTKTIVYDVKHRVVGEFFTENRSLVPLSRIPKYLVNATISTEDRGFYSHGGVSLWGIGRSLVTDVLRGKRAQGGSTLTQQLARSLFLTHEKTLSRKVKEAILALRIERQYSKDQILEMYFNQVYFGEGAYGVDAAARVYFDRPLSNLTLPECALIAGLTQNPMALNPRRKPQNAIRRRAAVLRAMFDNGKITRPEFDRALDAPLGVTLARPSSNQAPYFMEMVRLAMDDRYGSDQLYHGGLKIYTTLDLDLQKSAERALENQLARLEIQNHYKITRAMVNARPAGESRLGANYIQGSFLALQPSTGAIRALVGGRDFAQSPFNRVTQALRQPGSAFKPFVYAAALDNGYHPTDFILDAPISFHMASGTWAPQNYEDKFLGQITLRYALAHSINIPAIKLTERLTPATVASYAHRMGIKEKIQNNLTIALGTSEVSLIELCSAYTTFPNQGLRAEPLFILKVEDRNGRVLERNVPKVEDVLNQTTAATLTSMLQSVVDEGTAATSRAAGFTRPAGGKTGTTNDYSDAWFVGFTPDLLAGCWVGFDQRHTLGPHMTGNRAALPMWTDFMIDATRDTKIKQFPEASGMVTRQICVESGLLATPNCPETVAETYPAGQEPQQNCNIHTSSPGNKGENNLKSLDKQSLQPH